MKNILIFCYNVIYSYKLIFKLDLFKTKDCKIYVILSKVIKNIPFICLIILKVKINNELRKKRVFQNIIFDLKLKFSEKFRI